MDMSEDCWEHVGLLQEVSAAEPPPPPPAPDFLIQQQELLVSGGQPTTATSPAMSSGGALSPGALSPSSTATTTTGVGPAGTGGATTPVGGATGPGCCENGRPIITDPVTGQTVCSCQYDGARLALGAYPRLTPAAPSYSSYPTPTPSTTDQGPYPSIGMDSSAFYSPLTTPYALKDATGMGMTPDMSAAAWGTAALQPAPAGYYPYDSALAAYGYSTGYDLAARRKNATRESTATLKAWLNEHKKNPYPTKGEKIMLAIITKMTLTQVSTWFANARRRLKKENKMTWEPKNKTDDDDDAVLTDSEDNKEKDDLSTDNRSDRVSEEARRGLDDTEPMRHVKAELMQHEKDLDDEDDLDLEDDRRRSEHPFHHAMQHHHHHHQGYGAEEHMKEEVIKQDCNAGGVPIPATKPKIWSLADTAACKTPPPSHPHQQQYHHLHHQQHYPPHQQQQQQQQHHHHLPNQGHHHHSQQAWLGAAGAAAAAAGGSLGSAGSTGGGSLSSFALPSSASMSPSAAATTPYSSAAVRYGGFLSSSSGGQLHYNPNSSSGSSSSASSSAAAGFPEVGTDTPPQTPPNMKVATPNGVIQPPPGGYCPGGNANSATNGNPNPYGASHPSGGGGSGGYLSASSATSATSFSSRLQSSPHKDFSPVGQNSILHQHQTTASLPPTEATTAFKPFYKGSQSMGSGFVSPV